MNNASVFFSMIYIIAFAIYFYFGIFVIHNNSRKALNRVFFAMSISLSVWSIAFAIANSATSMETALIWRRVSALGWSTIYAILLHYAILLSREGRPLGKKFIYYIIYIPGLINMYIFGISNTLSPLHYNLTRENLGWINRSGGLFWDYFFRFYYLSYLFITIYIFWNWKKKTQSRDNKFQAKLMFYSIIATGIIGTTTDIILNTILTEPIPQIGPLVVMVPIVSAFYLHKRYNFLEIEKKTEYEEIILDKTRSSLYYFLSISFIIASLLGLGGYIVLNGLFSEYSSGNILLISVIFFVYAILVVILKNVYNIKRRRVLVLGAVILAIPILAVANMDNFARGVWAYPLLTMMFAILLDTNLPIIIIGVTGIFTQILIWYHASIFQGVFIHEDFVFRLLFYVVGLILALFANKVHKTILRESGHQIDFQSLITDISQEFVKMEATNLENSLYQVLERIKDYYGLDSAFLQFTNGDFQVFTCTCMGKSHTEPCINIKDSKDYLVELAQSEGQDNIFYINMGEEESSPAYQGIFANKINHLILIPLREKASLTGLIALGSKDENFLFDDAKKSKGIILGHLISESLLKIKSELEVEHMAYYDQLTGLPNRRLFRDRARQAIKLAAREGKLVAIVFLDIDSFKLINDTMGHEGGDKLLVSVADRLKNCIRESDTASRFGGDEFLILLNNIEDQMGVLTVAEKIMGTFSQPFCVENHEFFTTASVGIAVYPTDGEDIDSLIKNADIAMYQAKELGKNRYALCTSHMKEDVKRNMILSNHLHRAVDREELEIFYQPQVDILTNKIVGLEALLRWNHPEFGLVPPNIFIPLAEKNGQIIDIGNWVLRHAIRQNKAWEDQGYKDLIIGINLSVVQFNNLTFAKEVNKIIVEEGLEPSKIELEITESVASIESRDIEWLLKELRDIGVSIAIDDFGREYSSLGRLKDLPIDKIKIDMQFIRGIETNKKDRAITQVIINLAKKLGLEVIAEGVETEDQLKFLHGEDCNLVQGYYFYKPMKLEEVNKILGDLYS